MEVVRNIEKALQTVSIMVGGKGYKINDKYRRNIGGKWNNYTDDELPSDLQTKKQRDSSYGR